MIGGYPRLAARVGLLAASLVVISMLAATGYASQALASGRPQWTVIAASHPTTLPVEGKGLLVLTITNTGGAASEGTITISDELSTGLSLSGAAMSGTDELAAAQSKPSSLSCVLSACTYAGSIPPDDSILVTASVDVSLNEPGAVTNVVRVSGGGAVGASLEAPVSVGSGPAGFGVPAGGAATALSTQQAGAHPDLTTMIDFNTADERGSTVGDLKDTVDDLPPGFAGDLVDTETCEPSVFLAAECPIGSQVGVTTVTLASTTPNTTFIEPVYNLSPGPGELAALGFSVTGNFFYEGDVTLRSDYGLRTTFHNVTAGPTEVDGVSLTVWGFPADPVHDRLRFAPFANGGVGKFGVASDAPPAPFFTSPTECSGLPLEANVAVSSWQEPALSLSTSMQMGSLIGCDALGMSPSMSVEATTSHASAPSGLDLRLSIPQTYNNPDGLATSTLRQAVVTLPEGMTVNPSAGAGLGACSEAQFEAEEATPGTGGCPNESKLGTVKIVTPSLREEVTGSVFIAQPYQNPFGSLLGLYIVARIPGRGLIVKAAGMVHPDPLTGRLISTFDTGDPKRPHDGLPPLPLSLLTFQFHQGATSPLVTPSTCNQYVVGAQLSPLANPAEVIEPAIPAFPISTGFDGGLCPLGIAPFAPQFSAGMEGNDAGAYSPMEIHIARNDGEQEITGLSTQLPPGVTANLTGVPFCPEAAIAAARTKSGAAEEAEPSCPAASEIGHTLVGAGVGSVLVWTPGKLYMGGPYEGAPFSIISITSAKVGPFDLGTVVVHLPLEIDPLTAAVSVPAGPADQIPHIIDGIVIHVRDIRVEIDRPKFTINPTSCEPMAVGGSVVGSGANFASPVDDVSALMTAPFRATACQALAFKPKFSVSTSAKTSKASGASLSVKLAYPSAPQGTQANIARVKVDLPKQLPSRLTTLQKACTAAQFNANPAGCPAASFIGHARAITPILPVPLEGPAIFVSHGGEAFPSLELVLQGYGVTIDLVGSTFISKAGVTSSTFKAVPDQPVTSFELTLPEGKYSALAANGDLCTSKLAMPTEFLAQNGAAIHQSTPISVTGCPKRKAPTRAQKLASALKACHKQPRGKRAACEKAAHRKYGAVRKRK